MHIVNNLPRGELALLRGVINRRYCNYLHFLVRYATLAHSSFPKSSFCFHVLVVRREVQIEMYAQGDYIYQLVI